MTYEQITEAIYAWLQAHKRIIIYITAITSIVLFLAEATNVIE